MAVEWSSYHKSTHIHAFEKNRPDMPDHPAVCFYVLRKDSDDFAKITKTLIKMFEDAWRGKRHARVPDEEVLASLCASLHFVQPALPEWGHCACEGNHFELVCDCKGFKGYGICSHVLAINHILQGFNVRYQLARMGQSKALKATGRPRLPAPALTREQQCDDSSDEEEQRLLELGAQGK